MQHHQVRLTEEAVLDLAGIYGFVRKKSASTAVARNYAARIKAFIDGFETFPERGSIRDHVRPGLRIVGFERRVSIAFVIEPTEVIILRILYAGQQFETEQN
jgi:toxin ParE1/3/4